MNNVLRFMFFGDLIGKPGRGMFQKWAPILKKKFKIDAIIVNGENSSDIGRGITPPIANFLMESGANVITSGNHIWANKNIYEYINQNSNLIRPANYHASCPGKGYTFIDVNGYEVAIVNLLGKIFLKEQLDCPFRTMDSLLPLLKARTNLIFVDFHAEATSEKEGLGFFLDGRVSAIVGTHTHVQTSDEKILPNGTGYITDLGFSGSINSMLGLRKEEIVRKLILQMPEKFVVEEKVGPFAITGAFVEVDVASGNTTHIERFSITDEEFSV
ncbi:TPA: TIGR00282 family metallophosphoesterase [Candidatus Dependentiae bacterium]|nr:MAG: Metallophosphoesterase [candidate division TM6 bacterium GW2011_GWE2_31_21]KKP53592.1 MAG: Metallophosphoesterase [candidate division TM6 bacterium GW2011_GWF2_33_332]HBS48168.1 TIGR00282 family metallophosphoesterase [Candidatus Dependentiae bacterium]HBZ73592.1 TIGR00282 family metallophosphoesterase [Candidatus Dependentiae bacterium]